MCQRHFKYKETMKKIILFLIAITLFGCKKTTTEPKNNSISQESIYNLTSKWKTQDNKTIEIKDFKGKVTVMVMIYTSCKAACPRLVADMRDIESKMPKDKLSEINFVLVSIDPEVDTPERLKSFAKAINAFVFDVLGLEDEKVSDSSNDKLEGTINMLIEMRKQARDNKNFALSDQIRDQLIALGIQLKDGKEGTTFSI